MNRRIAGIVETILTERPHYQEVSVRLDAAEGELGRTRWTAHNLIALTGPVTVGNRVLLHIVALEGDGAEPRAFVVAGDAYRTAMGEEGERILKLRSTPMELPVAVVGLPDGPHYDALRLFASLDDMPVVCSELHLQLPAICAAAHWSLAYHKWPRPPRIAYIMTDSAGLALALSPLIEPLKAEGLLMATITAGQAFGGDFEAVNLYSALAFAREVVEADMVVVSQGPGHVGTGTPLGFTGIDQGLAVNATASLGGVALVVPRISFEDNRTRHRGLSHHTVTILNRIARANTLVPIPRLSDRQAKLLAAAFETTGITEAHEVITMEAELGLAALTSHPVLADLQAEHIAAERPLYQSAAAAGMLAAQLIEVRKL
ncbi:MAG TPA: DUF3866 family protein [Chthonomonadaceae bacterium]|nr:DUF3866 family protein [Chthonomonadaceae bacterium]